MGSITSGVGLVSGINSAQLIEQLLSFEARGKIPLQQKVATLTAQRTALLDVNARLLNLKNAAFKFRNDKVFQSSLATSSDETLLKATAGPSTPAGSYQFLVKRLASTSQSRTKGFSTADASPLGLDSLRFEFGDIGVARAVDTASLNGGDGIRRGKIVMTDKAGASSTVDLSTATTLDEIVDIINANDDVAITARIDGERLRLDDVSGGSGSLKITNASGGFTATDLGIATTTAGTSITSSQIHRLGGQTTLSSLNDGLGVLIRDNATDFKLSVSGTTYNITLGRVDLPITGATELKSLNNGVGVKINTTDAADFIVRTSTGTQVEINLGTTLQSDGTVDDPAVKTVQEMLTRVNQTLSDKLGVGKVVMTLRADGKGFDLTDTTGGSEPLRVLGAGPNADATAKNLGIFTGLTGGAGAVITGKIIKNQVATPRASTIQEVIDRIKVQTSNVVTASVNSAGTGLTLDAGGATITVLVGDPDGSSNPTAVAERTARDLGIFGSPAATIAGSRILAGAGTILARNINGGKGLDGADSLTLADRSGSIVTVNGLASYTTLEDLVDAVNSAAAGAGVLAALSVGPNNASLYVTDSSVGSGALTIGGDAAAKLGINGAGDANGILKGKNLEIKYISEAQSVGSLNYGKGLGTGQFKLTDSTGDTATVDIGSDSTTLYDVIREIDSRGLKIEARLNDTGDGISLIDTNSGTPSLKMKVTNVFGGVAAALGILGEAAAPGDDILGSYERIVDLDATDTLNKVITKIKAAGIPVNASLVNTGGGGTPFYLTFGSTIGGKNGQLTIDSGGVDLGLTTISRGLNAEIIFGNGNPAEGLALRSATNSFDDIVTGLDVTVQKASTSLVSVEVSRDVKGITEKVSAFVTAFNDAIARINDYDSYDIDTKKRGALLGNSTLARARQVMYSVAQGKVKNVSGQYQFLSQVGIKAGKDGALVIDQTKFDAAYASDPEGVEKLFTTFEQQTVASTSSFPGVTVGSSKIVATALGIGDLFDQAMKGLTANIDGAFTKASESFQTQITRTNDRIDNFDKRLQRRKELLQKQFQAMETALSKLQTQQSSLQSIQSITG